VQGDIPRSGGAAIRRENRLDRLTRVDRDDVQRTAAGVPPLLRPMRCAAGRQRGHAWAVGDRLRHSAFGEGQVTHLFGSGEKISLAVKFEGMGPKILDPRLAPIEAI
jgi:DNA helicase-2/ATP-dependent DNA helicase PcrA